MRNRAAQTQTVSSLAIKAVLMAWLGVWGLYSAGVITAAASSKGTGVPLSVSNKAVNYTYVDLGEGVALGINGSGDVVGGSSRGATLWNRTSAITLANGRLAFGINDAEQVVGTDAFGHATLWQDSIAIDLGTLGGTLSAAYSVNNRRQIVGSSDRADGGPYAVLWNGSIAIDLGGGIGSEAYSINEVGDIVGSRWVAPGSAYAVLWNGTTAIDLDSLGGTVSEAYGINSRGQVVGYSSPTGTWPWHATLWNGTAATDLGTLGGTRSMAQGINDLGQAVGWSDVTGDGSIHATLWHNAVAIDLNDFLDPSLASDGWVMEEAWSINNRGAIVGIVARDEPSPVHRSTRAFLLVPIR